MRPERDNIAAPELPGRIKWLNCEAPPKMAALTAAGPVLVHFFDPTQLNSVRALPYLVEWNRRYSGHGLTTVGIHSPRFALTANADVAMDLIERSGVEHAVALDLDYAIWHDYGCLGWPSLFLWGQGGALAWAHRGEGEYRATEEAIQDELRKADVTRDLPVPMETVRATDEPGALLTAQSDEILPGGSPAEAWAAQARNSRLGFDYEGGEAWVVADGEGELRAEVDGEPSAPVQVPPAGLIKLAGEGRHEAHRVELDVSEGVRVWAISFAPGAP
ncbi:MAG: hypothetical protein M3355_03840 [Actinomycetota bacterium]|nr:hypothetical protein [Actinomycetota bacterium]